MNTDEARNIIVRLNADLKDHGLDWVVQEVSAVVERGIEQRREVSLEMFDALDTPMKKRGPRTEVTVTRPFTNLEELCILLAAIKSAVIDANEIQESALSALKTAQAVSPRIFFRPDVPEGFEDKGYSLTDQRRGRPFDLSLNEVQARKEKMTELKASISELERKVRAD